MSPLVHGALTASLCLALGPLPWADAPAPRPGHAESPGGGAGSSPALESSRGEAGSWAAAEPPGETIGTIEATLDGEARTWYVVSGEVEGRRQPGAFWMEMGGDERMAVVGGYDTEDLDFSSFELQGGRPVSLGGYEGSMLSIGFPIGDGDGTGSWTPADSDVVVTYLADAQDLDYSAALLLEEGVVETTRIQTEGTCRFEGRFAGTLRPMGGEGEGVEIVDGAFRVEGCERFDVEGAG